MKSDMAWYCRQDKAQEQYEKIFFGMCRKYHVSWASASPQERCFIEEITRVTYERERAKRIGAPLSSVRPAFST